MLLSPPLRRGRYGLLIRECDFLLFSFLFFFFSSCVVPAREAVVGGGGGGGGGGDFCGAGSSPGWPSLTAMPFCTRCKKDGALEVDHARALTYGLQAMEWTALCIGRICPDAVTVEREG